MRIRKLVIIFSLFGAVLICQSISLAQSPFSRFDLGLEREIGYYNYRQVLVTTEAWHPDAFQRKQAFRVFNRLVSYAPRRNEVQFRLNFINDPSVNAFALPDGHVFVNSGLLEFVQSDAELAGILAHEISHVDRRHGMKAIYRAAGISLAMEIVLNQQNRSQAEELQPLANISANLAQLGYSREAEFEADKYGVILMEQAGYDKNDLLRFWRRMQSHSEEAGWEKTFTVLSTHPPVADRISRIEGMK